MYDKMSWQSPLPGSKAYSGLELHMASCLLPNFHTASLPVSLCDPANILWASSLVCGACVHRLSS